MRMPTQQRDSFRGPKSSVKALRQSGCAKQRRLAASLEAAAECRPVQYQTRTARYGTTAAVTASTCCPRPIEHAKPRLVRRRPFLVVTDYVRPMNSRKAPLTAAPVAGIHLRFLSIVVFEFQVGLAIDFAKIGNHPTRRDPSANCELTGSDSSSLNAQPKHRRSALIIYLDVHTTLAIIISSSSQTLRREPHPYFDMIVSPRYQRNEPDPSCNKASREQHSPPGRPDAPPREGPTKSKTSRGSRSSRAPDFSASKNSGAPTRSCPTRTTYKVKRWPQINHIDDAPPCNEYDEDGTMMSCSRCVPPVPPLAAARISVIALVLLLFSSYQNYRRPVISETCTSRLENPTCHASPMLECMLRSQSPSHRVDRPSCLDPVYTRNTAPSTHLARARRSILESPPNINQTSSSSSTGRVPGSQRRKHIPVRDKRAERMKRAVTTRNLHVLSPRRRKWTERHDIRERKFLEASFDTPVDIMPFLRRVLATSVAPLVELSTAAGLKLIRMVGVFLWRHPDFHLLDWLVRPFCTSLPFFIPAAKIRWYPW
ncbi:hypothetical protein EW146_g9587 [Bondarzewia mesenterica]|uniref:Uncharacterized protein n=1 Tax=Bondarzewia mesenterica TaxID=1095465 RepID=A0A4S4LA52_9AGAM|nr:hypothetical protein EW146_g9587 [Bondarzewia mesenterica]